MRRISLLLVLIAATTSSASADPNALWRIVHGQCVQHWEAFHSPLPCVSVDEIHGYAILKDIVGATQFLLIPTAQITGIEDPAVLAPDAPNYFSEAWEARGNVEALAQRALPREDLALAINSVAGRTQNQLHIHIDCVSPEVATALALHGAAIGGSWAAFPVRLKGHEYRAMRVETLDRPRADPFELLERSDRARESLVVVGATFANGAPGFYLLETRADSATGNRGAGEELQDHSCAVARQR
jgi:CDP-diacylglycerol pyrophosphatase